MHTPQPSLANLHQPHTLDRVNRLMMARVVATHPETDTVDVAFLAGGGLSHVPVLKAAAGRTYGDADLPPVTPGYKTAASTGADDTYCVVGYLDERVTQPIVLGFLGPYDSAMLKRPVGSALRRSVAGQTEIAYPDGSYELRTNGASVRMGADTALVALDPALDPGSSPATQLQIANAAGASLTLDASAGATLGGSLLTLAPDSDPSHAVTVDPTGLTLRGTRLAATGQDLTLANTGAGATTLTLPSSGTLDLKANSLTLNGNLVANSGGTLDLKTYGLTLNGNLSVGTGGGALNLNTKTLALTSNSTLNLNGNTLAINGTGDLSVSTGGGTLNMGGKSLIMGGNLTVSTGGTLNLGGRTLSLSSDLSVTTGGALSLNSSTLTVSAGGGTLNLNGSTLSTPTSGTLDLAGGTISGNGKTLTLNNNFTVGTGGTLNLASSSLTINANTTIGTIASGSGGTVTKTLLVNIAGNAITLFGN